MNLITVDNVSYTYPDGPDAALKNVTLKAEKGERLCLVGANGSGKSTLARLIAGLIKPDRGNCDTRAAASNGIPVGIVFQNPDNQMVAATVEKELAFSLENLNWPQSDMTRQVTLTLNEFEILHLRHRLTSELSGGEKQRVALASVMIAEPSVLILDEPDSFLDEIGKNLLQQSLTRIRSTRPEIIIIHITQYMHTARQYPRLIVFHEGEIVADAEPSRVFDDRQFCLQTGLAVSERSLDSNSWKMLNRTASVRGNAGIEQVEFEDVCYSFGDKLVIDRFSAAFKTPDCVGIVGYSGSGKSTLGALVCNLIEPQEGRRAYYDADGKLILSDAVFGRVSGVFQQPERQFFLSTALEELQFGPRNFGFRINRNEAENLLQLVGLKPEMLERDPLTFSGGEKRRLAFAAVLAFMPSLIVFDEPTCGLDPEGVSRFIYLAEKLKQADTGQIIISHDGLLLQRLCDRIITLQAAGGFSSMRKDEFFENERYCRLVSPLTP